jgi:hypothetical protein
MNGPYNYLDGPGPSPFELTSPHSDVPAIIDVAYVPDDGRLFATTNSPLSHLLSRTIGRRAAPNCSIIASHDRLSALRVTLSLDLPCLALRLQLRVWPPPPAPGTLPSTAVHTFARYLRPCLTRPRHLWPHRLFFCHFVFHPCRLIRRPICLLPCDGRRRRGWRRQPWP